MYTSLAMLTGRNLRVQYCRVVNFVNKHPIINFTNIEKVFKYDTHGPIDGTWTRWLKLNYRTGMCIRIDYGHTQNGKTFRDQIVDVIKTLGFPVGK